MRRSPHALRAVFGAVLAWLAATCHCLSAAAPPEPWNIEGLSPGPGQNAFSLPFEFLPRELRRAHAVGNSFFNKAWIPEPGSPSSRDGLGPLYNAVSCSSCHLRDGRGVPESTANRISGLVLRPSVPGKTPRGGPRPHPIFGSQIATQSILGPQPEAQIVTRYRTKRGLYPDGFPYELRMPTYQLQTATEGLSPPAEIVLGARLAPPVFGLGLLEAIPESTLLALSDPDDSNGDGISGRVNRVWHEEEQVLRIGRFGWKANQPTLRQQIAAAFLNDIGITSHLYPREALTPEQHRRLSTFMDDTDVELEERILNRIVIYQQTLAPPPRRSLPTEHPSSGQRLFRELQCAACHRETLSTGAHPISELTNRTIHPYTDLLLHDLGPGLADDRPDFAATGSEWRTAPLWGIGLTKTVSGAEHYLHDGRARNLEEAILWHAGEATASREGFRNLSASDRQQLIEFLQSL